MLRPVGKKVSSASPSRSDKVPVVSPSQSPTPHTLPRDSSNGTTGTPPLTHPVPAPASAFPVDITPETKRGPGRPPKTCEKCGKLASECKGHAEEKFSISDETVKGLIGLVSNLAAYGFSLSTGAPVEHLQKVWSFSEGEKTMLAPTAAEYINKSAPEWLKKYECEIKLALILTPIMVAKLAMTHAVVKMHKEQLAKENPPSPTVGTATSGTSPTRAAA